jgi:hypothetical protein
MSGYTRRTTSVKFRGREVQDPVLRKLVIALLVVMAAVFWVLFLVLSPLLLITHFALKAVGRHGFVYRTLDGRNYSIAVDSRGFRKVPSWQR